MIKRTIANAVTFTRPFVLPGLPDPLPAGTYEVETDEELVEGVSYPAYRKTSATIHLTNLPGRPGVSQAITVDLRGLEAALSADRTEGDPVSARRR